MSEADTSYLEAAAAIAGRLCRDALWSGRRCNWVGASMEPGGGSWQVVYRACGPDLYDGTAGIGLFLACAARATGERLFRVTAEGALRQALARAASIEGRQRIGLYTGSVGIAVAAALAAERLALEEMRAAGMDLLRSATDREADLSTLDVLAGCAGAIQGLLWAQARSGAGEWALEAAVRMGERLLGAAERSGRGWSWDTIGERSARSGRNLTGYSHGAAGIGVALLELWAANGDDRFREAGEGAFAYERGLFDPAAGNWPDLRDPESTGLPKTDGPSFMRAWCHGAPGVAMSRLRAWQLTQDTTTLKEARVALATTAASLSDESDDSAANCSLCHGGCGNAAVLACGSETLGDAAMVSPAHGFALRCVRTYHEARAPWPSGVAGATDVPGLMLGMSGTGMLLLRLHSGALAPDVLLIAPRSSA